jgi:hypothetical protein
MKGRVRERGELNCYRVNEVLGCENMNEIKKRVTFPIYMLQSTYIYRCKIFLSSSRNKQIAPIYFLMKLLALMNRRV